VTVLLISIITDMRKWVAVERYQSQQIKLIANGCGVAHHEEKS
jgi:hypothetical protein